jgi:MFS family permease
MDSNSSELIPIVQSQNDTVNNGSITNSGHDLQQSQSHLTGNSSKDAQKDVDSSSSISSQHQHVRKYRNEILALLTIALNSLIRGFTTGFTTSAIADLTSEGRLDDNYANWFASLYYVGCLLGCILASYVVDMYGRKLTTLVSNTVLALGWWFILADFHVSMLLIGRTLCGIGGSMGFVAMGMYMGECINLSHRGTAMVAATGMSITLGELSAFALCLCLTWRWLTVIVLVLLPVGMVTVALLAESPHWYVTKGRLDEARDSLMWLRMGDEQTVGNELAAIESSTAKDSHKDDESKVTIRQMIMEPGYRRAIILGTLSVTAVAICGHPAVLAFVWQIAAAASITNEGIITVALELVALVTLVVIILTINRAKRRVFIGVGGTTITVALLLLSLADLVQRLAWVEDSSTASIVGLFLFFIGFAVSWGSMSAVVLVEVLPTAIRGRGMGFAQAVHFLGSFLVAQTFLPLTSLATLFGVFLIYAVLNTIIVCVLFKFLPDTHSQSLEDIEKYFQEN